MENRKRPVAWGTGTPVQGLSTRSSAALCSTWEPTWEPTCPHRPPYAWVATQALMAFQRSLSVLLMLPVWQGMEAMSSK